MTKVCSSTFSPTLLEVLLFLSLRQSYGFRIGSTGGVTIKSSGQSIFFYGHYTDLIFATALHHFHQGLPRPNSFRRDSDDYLDQHLAAPQAISSISVRSSFEYSAAQQLTCGPSLSPPFFIWLLFVLHLGGVSVIRVGV